VDSGGNSFQRLQLIWQARQPTQRDASYSMANRVPAPCAKDGTVELSTTELSPAPDNLRKLLRSIMILPAPGSHLWSVQSPIGSTLLVR
jgi:hypothetical protein